MRAIETKYIGATNYKPSRINGMYNGWTEHVITVRPSLQFGITLSVSGRNCNDIKDYIAEIFQHALTQTIAWDGTGYTAVEG